MPKLTVATEGVTPIELYYEDHGSGKPVVLIHGWPLSGRTWENQVPALVDAGFRVVHYDRRGFGWSAQPWGGYDYDTFAADLDVLLGALDLREATLVGFSMGGGEVARYVGRYGTDRIAKAVFASAVPPFLFRTPDNPEGPLDDEAIGEREAAVKEDRLAFLEAFIKKFFAVDGKPTVSDAVSRHIFDIAAFASPKGTLDCIRAFGRTDFRDDLRCFDIPTLVLHGDADAVVPFEVSGKRTLASIPGASLALIKGGPHGINASHAKEFNRALLDFI